MKINEYEKLAPLFSLREFRTPPNPDLVHGVLGLSSESGELINTIKAHLFYGKSLDVANIKEELGDILWFLTLISSHLKISMESILKLNIEKLKKRYEDGVTTENACNRDVKKERSIFLNSLKKVKK